MPRVGPEDAPPTCWGSTAQGGRRLRALALPRRRLQLQAEPDEPVAGWTGALVEFVGCLLRLDRAADAGMFLKRVIAMAIGNEPDPAVANAEDAHTQGIMAARGGKR